MNRLVAFVLFMVPGLVLADNSLNFAPPASDYSMIFLGNLFGVVDGVLSGSGSQIMGSMFAVFNAAVLALGGIIIMYTLMVSTMNTAHEGQMLGQKWSSIWIPVRSTVGLALLIPKASGYCLMQIFVMWIVVQGVGAADKVWNAALSYLNRGGVIIQAQQASPAAALAVGLNGVSGVAKGAYTILAGQVCMLGIQTQLQNLRKTYLDQLQKKSGPCYQVTKSSALYDLCNTPVPDFIGTVNAVTVQGNNPTGDSFSVVMPNFDSSSAYSFLNGTCGTIEWNNISSITSLANRKNTKPNATSNWFSTIVGKPQSETVTGNTTNVAGTADALGGASTQTGENFSIGGVNLNSEELGAVQMSRAIAIQQMYVDLAGLAQTLVGNSPGLSSNKNNNDNSNTPYSGVAFEQFGVPYTKNSTQCPTYDQFCVLWGAATGSSKGVLFNGTEFINALTDYNGVMMPTLNLMVQLNDAKNAQNSREFIANASTQGWIMAGAYFYNLVKIQGSATMNQNMVDTNTGLEKSSFDPSNILASFTTSGNAPCGGLCAWFDGNRVPLQQVEALINGAGVITENAVPTPDFSANMQRPLIAGNLSSTVNGFVNNSLMMQTPGQPGLKPLTFANQIHFSVDTSLYTLKRQSFECGEVKITFFKFCLGRMMGNLFYNVIFLFIYNTLMQIFGQIIHQVVMAFLMIPISGMADIFKQGVQVLSEPGVNPVVALANMGVQYINFSGNLWIVLLNMAVTSALIPIFGMFIFALITLALPLLMAWVGIMTSIGFTTAYYVPILPYMIFTFGALAWLMSVVEAMVAAPIVALGVTHPEGHDAFGKGEAAIMILINVFLRPSMMIIGYISAIALSYVGIWILNAGFDTAISPIQQQDTASATWGADSLPAGGYSDWAGIYAYFFSILIYTTMYLIMVQKAFTLISLLPDKVLRWIGGSPESYGQEVGQWTGEAKEQTGSAAKATTDAQGQMDKQLGSYGMKGLGKAQEAMGKGGGSGGIEGSGESTASKGDGGGGDSGDKKSGGGGPSSGGPGGGGPSSGGLGSGSSSSAGGSSAASGGATEALAAG